MGRRRTPYMEFVRAHGTEYATWIAMKQRCYNPDCPEYTNYGGRGIGVCAEWRNSFLAFVRDMGQRPTNLSLDRIDNGADYSPNNCRWTTLETQSRNRRCTRNLTYNGRTMCLTDWATELGIHHQTLRNRLKRGWPLSEALAIQRVIVTQSRIDGRWVGR